MAQKLDKTPLKPRRDTVEQKVTRTILKDPLKVKIGEKTYSVKPPTLSVIFRVSAMISEYPQTDTKLSKAPEEVLKHVLLNAYQYDTAGAVLATLILGWSKYPSEEFLAQHEALATEIEDTFEPRQYDDLLARLLNVQQVSDFFRLTATLSELNLIEGKRRGTITDSLLTD